MLLLLEVYLSIKAWNAGWQGWIFVPWIGCLLIGFWGGLAIGPSGLAVDDMYLVSWLVGDLPLMVTLFLMSKYPRIPKSATLTEI